MLLPHSPAALRETTELLPVSLAAKLCMAMPTAAPRAVANSSTQRNPLPITWQPELCSKQSVQSAQLPHAFPLLFPLTSLLFILFFLFSFSGLLLPSLLWVSTALLGQTIY